MSAQPEPMLLENGDILVPAEDGSQMVKLRPGEEGHAEWLAHLQAQTRRQAPVQREAPPPAREARPRSAGRTAARIGIGLIVFIVIVVVLLVIAALVIVSLVSDLELPELPDIPGLPEDTPELPEEAPGGN